jgi:serine/threonine protein kinase
MALDQSTATSTFLEGGTTSWMSPELIYPGRFDLNDSRQTEESDWYALGMVIYEVLSGQRPFAEDGNFIIVYMILDGQRPKRPQGKDGELFTDDIWETLELCWKQEPCDRISASAVLLRLEAHPPLLRPPFNVGEGVEADSDDQSDTGSGVCFPSYPWLIFIYPRATAGSSIPWLTFSYPRAIAGSSIVPFRDRTPSPQSFDDGPPSPQTANPRRGWLGRTWKVFEATTKKIQGR